VPDYKRGPVNRVGDAEISIEEKATVNRGKDRRQMQPNHLLEPKYRKEEAEEAEEKEEEDEEEEDEEGGE